MKKNEADKQADIVNQKMKEAINILSEHCDSIQIFAEFTEGGETVKAELGKGSFYARLGMSQEFLDTNKARVFHHIKKIEFTNKSTEDDTPY